MTLGNFLVAHNFLAFFFFLFQFPFFLSLSPTYSQLVDGPSLAFRCHYFKFFFFSSLERERFILG